MKRRRTSRQCAGAGPRHSGDGQFEPRTVVAISESKDEANAILDEVQYWEAVQLVKRLDGFGNPKETSDLSIRQFGDFWELRLKGGFFKRINLRIYFAHVAERNEIVVLMAYKKEEDRRTCPSIKYTLEDRLEDYLNGKRTGISTYQRGQEER
jgi:hypothetical protein